MESSFVRLSWRWRILACRPSRESSRHRRFCPGNPTRVAVSGYSHGMHPGIHHEPYRAPHFVAQLPEFRIRIFVHAQLFAEALRIQCPALDKRGVAEVFSKFRYVFHLLPERKL